MLLGQVDKKIDTKNRLSFPYRFRKELGDRLIITKNMEGSLLIVSEKAWQTLLSGTKDKPFIRKEARETQRFLFGSAVALELDEKGRFILPQSLRIYSGIEENAVFVGVYNRVEVWDKKRWEEYSGNYLERNINKITKKLSDEE